jgi:hypothetical protein
MNASQLVLWKNAYIHVHVISVTAISVQPTKANNSEQHNTLIINPILSIDSHRML